MDARARGLGGVLGVALGTAVLGCNDASRETTGLAASSASSASSVSSASSGAPSAAASGATPVAGSASATGSASAASGALPPVGIPVPAEAVAKIVNPRGQPAYAGPTGTLRGTVHIEGDPAPLMQQTFPVGKCGEAAATYGKLFRAGQDHGLADVLVGVTEYEGFVPAREDARRVTLHGCAISTRTIAMTFGQRLEVRNTDSTESYMPFLDDAKAKAVMVAVPGGDAVKLYPLLKGHYALRDQLPKPFMSADVYVLAYATLDVTGLDGKFEIPGIPVGHVKVSAFWPALDKAKATEVDVASGDNQADFTFTFDRKKEVHKAAPASSAAASGAAAGKP